MCGVAGLYLPRARDCLEREIRTMTSTLVHRGPDREGYWIEQNLGVGLGHRRLSMLDLSPSGDQPMISASGRYVLTFNGEIYNHVDLKKAIDLSHYRLQGTSDTEVFLAHIEQHGLEATLERACGMFAFAIVDRTHRQLILVRDRFGEKPLYLCSTSDGLIFGSELKALKSSGRCSLRVSRNSLAEFSRYGFIPGSNTIYEDVAKLRPGTLISIALDGTLPVLREKRW